MTAEETSTSKSLPDNQLAMSRMKEEIEKIANKEADSKLSEAKLQAEKIVADAKNESDAIKKRILDQARNEAETKKVREVSRKKLSVKMDYLQTREGLIDEIIVEAKSELQKYTKSKEYPGFLSKLVKSSALSIGGGDLVLHLRTEDKSHFTNDSLAKISKEVTAETGLDTSISVSDDNLNALGGIKLVRSDNRLLIDNTFESRLLRANEETRVALLEVLS